MRTKTVLLTAVLGLVGAATVSAQVYSVNVVGYANSTLKAGFNLIANPLNNTAANGNTVGVLFGTALADGAGIYKFAAGAYQPANFYSELLGWDDAAQLLEPGQGAFVYLPPGTADKTVTFVGDVLQGHLVIELAKGFNMVSSKVPQAGALVAALGYTPADGDAVYKHIRGAGYESTITYSELLGWDPGDPTIEVGEAFWLYREAQGTWTRDFTVQ